MKKFNNWMKKKGFEVEKNKIFFYVSDGVHPTMCDVILNKQMLIGYMIEYLWEKEKSFALYRGNNIDDIYNQLEKQIKELK